MLVYPERGLQADVSIPKFRVSFFVMAGGYMVQHAGLSEFFNQYELYSSSPGDKALSTTTCNISLTISAGFLPSVFICGKEA